MAVKKKKEPSVQDFIDKGADVKTAKEKSFQNILVRMPISILEELDDRLLTRPWWNRTQWIVEAVQEKLKCDV